MTRITPEGRRALMLALEHGGLTAGTKGFYPGFTTGGGHRPVRRSSLKPLEEEGWLERDRITGRMRLTDRGRIAAQHVQREDHQIQAALADRRRRAAARQPAKPAVSQPERKVRLPYADD